MLVREIIKGALKKGTVLPIGREPSAAQNADGLVALQALYRELIGQGVFGRLTDVLVTTSVYAARENERVVIDAPAGCDVTLPKQITLELLGSSPGYAPYGAYDYGRGWGTDTLPRPPRDGSAIVIADVNSDLEKYYLYDGNRAYWVWIDELDFKDRAPLGTRYENGLKAKLWVRLASSYGRQITPFMQGEVNTFHSMISHKNDRERKAVATEYF